MQQLDLEFDAQSSEDKSDGADHQFAPEFISSTGGTHSKNHKQLINIREEAKGHQTNSYNSLRATDIYDNSKITQSKSTMVTQTRQSSSNNHPTYKSKYGGKTDSAMGIHKINDTVNSRESNPYGMGQYQHDEINQFRMDKSYNLNSKSNKDSQLRGYEEPETS